MSKIVHVHFPDIEENLLREVVKAFYNLRKIDDIRKKPSTSELIDWLKALIAAGIPYQNITRDLPFVGTLLKKENDYNYLAKVRAAGTYR